MTEAEWLTSDDPIPVMCGLRGHVGDRKMTLFEVACAESLKSDWPDPVCAQYLDHRLRRLEGARPRGRSIDLELNSFHDRLSEAHYAARERAEELLRIHGPADPSTVGAVRSWVAAYILDYHLPRNMAWWDWFPIYLGTASTPGSPDELFATEYEACFRQNLPVLRCIVGNPFRPATLDPSWLTSTVVALARGIYEDRAFDRMTILADALQDAGCDSEDVLNHCRGPGPHVRGCWVVDLVLGKS